MLKSPKTHWNPELYNDKHAFVYKYGESLIDLLDPKKDERILDLGCGAGQLTALINEKANETVGIDKSAKMIENAKAHYPDIQFETADAANFSFKLPFDAIFSNATLHWVLDYENAIRCMYESLKPGGRIVIEFGGKGNIASILNTLKETLRAHGYMKQANTELWFFPSISQYTSALEAAGFQVSLAQLYDRPTELADEKTAIKDWIEMFGSAFFKDVESGHKEQIKDEVQQTLKPQLFKSGKWCADYKRLRIIAHK
ncbi:MAG: methyltransferase domain-containing protein [Leeuwenhoekiella sp.]